MNKNRHKEIKEMTNERLSVDADLWWTTDEFGHRLYDADGEGVGWLPGTFSDEQVRAAVRLANSWYATGVGLGEGLAMNRMRAALGINSITERS